MIELSREWGMQAAILHCSFSDSNPREVDALMVLGKGVETVQ